MSDIPSASTSHTIIHSVRETLVTVDRDLFIFINRDLSNPTLDQVMPVWTELHKQPLFWVAIGLLIAFKLIAYPRDLRSLRKKATLWMLGLVLTAASMGLADFVAYRGVKVWVERPRPEAAGVPVLLRTNSHSGWSFPSNHAANCFALARTVQILAPTWSIPIYLFAASIAFSRVYVGVHYPFDVLIGGLIGILCANFILWGALKIFPRLRRHILF